MPEGRRRLLYGSSSSPWAALCSRLVGGDCWRCQPAAYCVLRPDSLVLQAVPLAVDSGWRLETLLAWLFVVAAVCFVLSTRRLRDCWQCQYAARDVTRLDGSLRQTMLSPSMTGPPVEATLWLFIVAVGGFMFTARRLLKLLV